MWVDVWRCTLRREHSSDCAIKNATVASVFSAEVEQVGGAVSPSSEPQPSLASSCFKQIYHKTKVPRHQHQLFAALHTLLVEYATLIVTRSVHFPCFGGLATRTFFFASLVESARLHVAAECIFFLTLICF
jgi:hypothetical protein